MNASISLIQSDLRAGRNDRAIEGIRSLGTSGCAEVGIALLDLMHRTSDHTIRGVAAMALSDMGYYDCVAAIAELLRNPKTLNARGPLLFALSPFDCTPLVELLLTIATDGQFEERCIAAQLLADVPGPVDRHMLTMGLALVRRALVRATTQDRLDELEALTTILFDLLGTAAEQHTGPPRRA